MDDFKKTMKRVQIPIENDKRARCLSKIRCAAAEKRVVYEPSKWEIFREQLGYISKGFFISQLLILAAAAALCVNIGNDPGKNPYYLATAALLVSLPGITIVTELGRHMSCAMAELELTCYLNLKQIWTAKMIVCGIADMVIVTALMCTAGIKLSYQIYAAAFYLLVPLIYSHLCCLLLFTMLRRGRGGNVKVLSVPAAAACALVPPCFPGLYDMAQLWIWAAALAAGAGLLVFAVKNVLKNMSEEGEQICWN